MKFILPLVFVCAIFGAVIATDHVDIGRTGWNPSETVLTPTAVAGGSFGKTGVYSIDGYSYAQTLFIPSITIFSVIRNVAIAVTMHNSVYAFNADAPGSFPLWHTTLPITSRTSYPDDGFLLRMQVGCLSTPAADVTNSYLFVVCASDVPTWVLYKLDLTTGSILSSVVVTATVTGTGDTNGIADNTSGPNLIFYPYYELARSGLTIANNNVYVAFSAYDDTHPWHGWVMGYSESSLSQIGAICLSPNGFGAGIWHASGGVVVDGNGNLYVATGNGDYNGVKNFGNSVVKLSPTLVILDWYTPTNWAALLSGDLDISSGRPFIVPGTDLVVVGFKDFNIYSIHTSCMGHVGGTVGGCTAPQIFVTNGSGVTSFSSGVFGGMFMNGIGYFPVTNDKLYAFSLSGTTWNTTATTTSSTFFPKGVQVEGSSNGALTGVVWGLSLKAAAFTVPVLGTLRAFNPSTLSELWNSDSTVVNQLGIVPKFVSPVIANGTVFVSGSNVITTYGLAAAAGVSSQSGGNVVRAGSVN